MPKFRKKPVVIEALQFDDKNSSAIIDFVFNDGSPGGTVATLAGGELIIHTLEGDMHVSEGDYVIRGVQGECYPCKPDIFDKTYEAVDATVN